MGEPKPKAPLLMLSISPPMKGAGQGNYYLQLAREDYYLEGGEPPGRWVGLGAEALNLDGVVDRESLHNLLSGFDPKGREAWVQNPGSNDRQSGWDLTFSAPKSVSVLWSQLPSGERTSIQEAHAMAVRAAVGYLEDVAAVTRRGKGGLRVEAAKFIGAVFEHGTSRAQDPQIHSHVLILNTVLREDGSTGTLRSRDIFRHKMAAGAVYRAELAKELQRRLGVEVERVKGWFEIKGVSQSLIEEFSKRRQEVEEALAKRGVSGPEAAKIAALDTRDKKAHRPRAELLAEWQGRGVAHGWSVSQALGIVRQGRWVENRKQFSELSAEAIAKLTQTQSYFSERDLVRHTAEAGQGRGAGAAEVRQSVKERLKSKEVVPLKAEGGERMYTTREMLELERDLLRMAEERQTDDRHRVPLTKVLRETESKPELSDEQKSAIEHVTAGKGAIAVVAGMAGTGKSTLLGVARSIWEAAGFEVRGAALSGKAAQGLQDGSGIQSFTIASTLAELRKAHAPVDFSQEAFGGSAGSPKRLTPRTVLVVDEAGMVGTRQLHELLKWVREAGAKLVLVGDAKQLQPIEAGGPFRALSEQLGAAELTEIKRQREGWARQAVTDMARGEAQSVLHEFAARDRLRIEDSRKEVMDRLIRDWAADGVRAPEQNLILTNSNDEVRELNRRAQDERLKARALGDGSVRVQGDHLYPGDRVLFTRNSRLYGVMNGSLGTVQSLSERSIRVTLDTGRTVSIPLAQYEHIRLGYAATTHKAQGMTAENTYILAGGSMQDREISSVQVSRARGKSVLYVDKDGAGEAFSDLGRQMAQSRAKKLAHSLGELTPHKPSKDREQGREY